MASYPHKGLFLWRNPGFSAFHPHIRLFLWTNRRIMCNSDPQGHKKTNWCCEAAFYTRQTRLAHRKRSFFLTLSYAKSLFTGIRAGCFSFFLVSASVPLAVSRTVPVFPVWDGLFHGLGPASGRLFLLPGRFFYPILPVPVGRSSHYSLVADAYATVGGSDCIQGAGYCIRQMGIWQHIRQ